MIDIWAVIPARWGSTRFPGKSITLIDGKPMIQRVWEQVKKASFINHVLVATDDERIVTVVKKFGGDVVMTDPNHTSGTSRILEAIHKVRGYPFWVINVQGDEPLINPADLDKLISNIIRLDSTFVKIGTLIFPILDRKEFEDHNVVKVVLDNQNRAMYFSRSPIPFNAGNRNFGWRHLGIYMMQLSLLDTFKNMLPRPENESENLEQLRILEYGMKIHCVEADYPSVGVDVPSDVIEVERILKGKNV